MGVRLGICENEKKCNFHKRINHRNYFKIFKIFNFLWSANWCIIRREHSLNWSCCKGYPRICTNLHFSKNFIATFLWGFWSFMFFFETFELRKWPERAVVTEAGDKVEKYEKFQRICQLWSFRFYELFYTEIFMTNKYISKIWKPMSPSKKYWG